MSIIPETVTPKQLAAETGWSERYVRTTARALNACLGRGRGMRLTRDDVHKIMEAKRCPISESTGARAARSGAIAGQLPAGDYEVLRAQRTKSERRELRPRKKSSSGNVISMDLPRS
jgi:hypothetical protein